ncbi:MAG: hypothetical protein C0600_09870 [Ignavibacteria bacterium]|nr:MAG: hypothetical protein C0600_09870 [Ignavibacteria bacterium]
MMGSWLHARVADLRSAVRGEAIDTALWIGTAVALVTLIFSIALAQAAVLLTGLLWLYNIARTRGRHFRLSPLLPPVTAFVVARIAAIPLSIDPAGSMDAFRTEIPFYILFYVIHSTWDARREDRLRAVILLVFTAALVAVAIGFIRYAQGFDERLTSTTSGYYTLGMFLATVFAMVFALGRNKDIFPQRWIWLLTSAILLIGLLFTFNRLHWVVAALAALVVGLLRERRILLILAILGIAAVATVEPLQDRFLQLLDAGGNMSGRDVIWRGAWMLIADRPVFGFGLRTFTKVFPLFDEVPDKGVGSWHNDYLQVYMDSGLVALIPFVAIIGVALYLGWKNHQRWPSGSLQRDINAASVLAIGCFALAGGMLDSLLSILFRTLIALTAVLYMQRPPCDDTQPELRQ